MSGGEIAAGNNAEVVPDNLELWKKVEKTNPKYTKKANIGGMPITSISPQYQILSATEQFGIYGEKWGFKNIDLDFSLVNMTFEMNKTEGKYPNVKVVGKQDTKMGLVVFKATFFHPTGEFEVINSIDLFTSNARNKVDDNFAKKIETDALTKALSKLGFNADIFMGKFDDVRYVEERKEEFGLKPKSPPVKPKPRVYSQDLAIKGLAKNYSLAEMMIKCVMTAENKLEYTVALDEQLKLAKGI